MLVSFPQEDSHHTDRVLNGKQPMEVGQAGRAALEIASAAHECRRRRTKPVELWLRKEPLATMCDVLLWRLDPIAARCRGSSEALGRPRVVPEHWLEEVGLPFLSPVI
jgi:hypothetical protein